MGLAGFVVGVVGSFPRTPRSYTPLTPFLTIQIPTVFKPPHPTISMKAPLLLGCSVVGSRNRKPPHPTTSHHGCQKPPKRPGIRMPQTSTPQEGKSERFGAFRGASDGGFRPETAHPLARPEKPSSEARRKRGRCRVSQGKQGRSSPRGAQQRHWLATRAGCAEKAPPQAPRCGGGTTARAGRNPPQHRRRPPQRAQAQRSSRIRGKPRAKRKPRRAAF